MPFAHGMRNEIAANKLNHVDDLHKLFHHACQLVCSFLGMIPRQKDDDSSKAGPEPVHKGGHLVAHPVGSSSSPCLGALLSVSCLILPARDGFLPEGLSQLCWGVGSLGARMPTHTEPSPGAVLVRRWSASHWPGRMGDSLREQVVRKTNDRIVSGL